MLFGQDRGALRRIFFTAWHKQRAGEPMEPLETMIAAVIAQHPEYHAMLEEPDRYADRDYLPEMGETNPFLHMAMHLSIQEQLDTARPAGIREQYQTLMQRLGEAHAVEHEMMECLAEMLWEAQRENRLPDEAAYLACLQRRANTHRRANR